jgi:regulator of sigma D
LKKGTDNAKKEYLDNKCNEIIEFQSTGHYDLMYMKTKGPGWNEKHGIQNIYIEDSKVNTIVDRRQELKIWENYITELYNQTNRSENLDVKL